jgi:hypothetical protein
MSEQQPRWTKRQYWGISLVFLSFVIWGSIAVLPFLVLPNKILIGTILYGFSYFVFFVGGYLAGKDTITTIKNRVWKR